MRTVGQNEPGPGSRLVALLVVLLAACSVVACSPRPEVGPSSSTDRVFDTILRGGLVYDGSGGPGREVDIGIRGQTLAAIEDLSGASAEQVLELDGLAVAPGFINMLSWAAEPLRVDGHSQSDIRQGVTLEVFGEGQSIGPLNETMKEQIRARQTSCAYEVDWTTLDEGLESLVRSGVAPNVASFVGATTIRIHVLGYEDRPPTPQELEQMRGLVRRAMEDGALGVGSSLIYAPAFYATTDELVALGEVAAEYDGMYISHIRDEGNQLLEALEEFLLVAEQADIRAEIYHFKAKGERNWPKLDEAIARIERARAEGLEVSADMYTYAASSTGLNAAVPPWVQEGGLDAWIERMKEPAIRERLRSEMAASAVGWTNNLELAGKAENVLLVGFRNDSLRKYTGKTLAEVAQDRGTNIYDTVMDLVIEDQSRVDAVYFVMNEENLAKKAALPFMTFGSDAGSIAPQGGFLDSSPHPRTYGNFARVLGRFVRDERVLTMSEAIRRLTSLPAHNLRLERRGALAVGNFADIVVFDPARIRDLATFEEPHQYSLGMVHVFVNGKAVLLAGEHTGATPGQVVRGPGARRSGRAVAPQ